MLNICMLSKWQISIPITARTIRNTASFRIAQLAVAHRRLADSVLRELGLHVGQEMLMNALWEEGAEISQSELAERLGGQTVDDHGFSQGA